MNMQTKSLSEISQQALALLTKELGVVDSVRFLHQFMAGYGEYTLERDNLFADLTLDEILCWPKLTLRIKCDHGQAKTVQFVVYCQIHLYGRGNCRGR